MRTVTLVVVLVALVTGVVGARQGLKPTFEVASVKRNVSGAPGFGGPTATAFTRPTGFSATNVELPTLIRMAYRFDGGRPSSSGSDSRILGGPAWVNARRFDIVASAGSEVSRDDVYRMLKTLLEDRFKLIIAWEQRVQDAYTLRLARDDGHLGPDLRKAADDCDVTKPKNPIEQLKLMPRPSSGAGPSVMNICGTIQNVADTIGGELNATVVDGTGLTGRWDYVISHAGLQSGMRRGLNGVDEERPSIFVAIQEQLGLKVERRHEPGFFDVLVIKSVELPSEN